MFGIEVVARFVEVDANALELEPDDSELTDDAVVGDALFATERRGDGVLGGNGVLLLGC